MEADEQVRAVFPGEQHPRRQVATVTGTLGELTARYTGSPPPKGEIVVVVSPPLEPETVDDSDLDEALRAALAKFTPSRAAADVANRLGVPRKRAYARALDLAGKQ